MLRMHSPIYIFVILSLWGLSWTLCITKTLTITTKPILLILILHLTLNPILTSNWKPSPNTQTGFWSCEDQLNCPHLLLIKSTHTHFQSTVHRHVIWQGHGHCFLKITPAPLHHCLPHSSRYWICFSPPIPGMLGVVGNAGSRFLDTRAGQILGKWDHQTTELRTEEEKLRQVFSCRSHEGWSGSPDGGDIWGSRDSVFLPSLCFRLLAGGQWQLWTLHMAKKNNTGRKNRCQWNGGRTHQTHQGQRGDLSNIM